MKLRTGLRFVIGLTTVASISGQETAALVPVLTVCEALRNLKTYNGKDVVLVGRAAWTFEGTFLSEECEPDRHIMVQGNRWLSVIYLASDGQPLGRPIGFQFDEEPVRRKLLEVQRTTRLTSEPKPTSKSNQFADRWMAVLGRLVSPPALIPGQPVKNSQSKNTPGNGFGANGSVPAKVIKIMTYDLSARE
jgi:hypothetical protein